GHNGFRRAVEPPNRNYVVGEGCSCGRVGAGGRIEELLGRIVANAGGKSGGANGSEISSPLSGIDGAQLRDCSRLRVERLVVIGKKEQLAFDDGSAESYSEIVIVHRGPWSDLVPGCIPSANNTAAAVAGAGVVVLPAIRIQAAAAKVIVKGTVEVIGSGLDGYVDHTAQVIAEIGGRASGDEVELLGGLRGGYIAHVVVIGLIVVHSIEDEVVLLFASAVDVRPSRAESILGSLEPKQVGRDHARRRNQSQLVDVVG